MTSIGECHAGTTTAAHGGGYLGLIVAAPAAYLSCTEACEAPHGHSVLPGWPWPSPNHPDRSHRH
ncbi:MAG: hypothetical protein ABR922_12955 [Streptosporangiaceae bacterium]|jgi:succinate-acetate transporter protein